MTLMPTTGPDSVSADLAHAVPPPGSGTAATCAPPTATLVAGEEAVALLGDRQFVSRWRALHAACSWSTGFQAPGFARTWYATHAPRYAPLLVVGTDPTGELRGLLALATDRAGAGAPVVAGGWLAEYQCWLAGPRDGEAFATAALEALARRFPAGSLTLRYLPAGAPLGWAAAGTRWGRLTHLESHPRPLRSIGRGAAAASLRKTGNRSRDARLARGEPLRFERLAGSDALAAVMPEIATCYDLRQAAMHGARPFHDDPLAAHFFVALAAEPGLLHATVVRRTGALVSAHLGVAAGGEVALGIIAHAPTLAHHSPGKLHLLRVADSLEREGYTTFDLTPGGDAYKERFATHHDVVHEAQVFFSRAAYARHAARARLRRTATRGVDRALAAVGQDRASARQLVARAAGAGIAGVPGKLGRWVKRTVYDRRAFRLYRMAADVARELPLGRPFRRDQLADLLAYDPKAPEAPYPTLAAFLKDALGRVADGLHVYTAVEDGVLVHYGWLTERQERMFVTEVGHEVRLPPNAAVAWDDWTHPRARGRGMQRDSVRQRLRDAAAVPGTEWVVCGLVATNGPSRANMERVGFVHYETLFTERRLGGTRRWAAPAGAP